MLATAALQAAELLASRAPLTSPLPPVDDVQHFREAGARQGVEPREGGHQGWLGRVVGECEQAVLFVGEGLKCCKHMGEGKHADVSVGKGIEYREHVGLLALQGAHTSRVWATRRWLVMTTWHVLTA